MNIIYVHVLQCFLSKKCSTLIPLTNRILLKLVRLCLLKEQNTRYSWPKCTNEIDEKREKDVNVGYMYSSF